MTVEIDKYLLKTGWPSQKNEEWKKILDLIFEVTNYDLIVITRESKDVDKPEYVVRGLKELGYRRVE